MALEKILVAYDGSETAKRALAMAARIVGDEPTQLDVATVVAIPLLSEEQVASFSSVLSMMESDAKDILAEASGLLSDAGVTGHVETLLAKGVDAAAELAKVAETGGYDMVIVGSRGLSGMKEYLGSVSHKLLGATKVPVLVVK